jgi:hypothetical protein
MGFLFCSLFLVTMLLSKQILFHYEVALEKGYTVKVNIYLFNGEVLIDSDSLEIPRLIWTNDEK